MLDPFPPTPPWRPRRRPRLHLAVLLALLLPAAAASARTAAQTAGEASVAEESAASLWDQPFHPDAAAVARAAAALPPTADGMLVLIEDMSYVYREDGSVEYRRRLVYRLDSQQAADAWSSLSASWEPWHMQRPELRARVISVSGEERWLDHATVAEEPLHPDSPNLLSDARRLRAPLPGVGVGSVVESEVVRRETAPLSTAGVVDSEVIGFGVPVQATRLVLSYPAALPFTVRTQLLDGVEPVRQEADGRVSLRFELAPREPLPEVEDNLPGDVAVLPRIAWSTGRSWAEVAAAYAAQVEAQIAGAEVDEQAAAVVAGLDDRDAKIAALVAWLHRKVRYTGLEFGEAALVPRRPAEVLARGYGDCKDKSALLVALLRAAGIDAELALLRVAPRQDSDPDLPGLGAFNHAVVHVPAAATAATVPGSAAAASEGAGDADGSVWIDATAESFPPGLLPAGAQGRLALLARPSGGRLVETPATRPEDNLETSLREVWMAELGKGRLVETVVLVGLPAASIRAGLAPLTAEQLTEVGERYAEQNWLADRLVDWHTDNLQEPSLPLRMYSEMEGTGLVVTAMLDSFMSANVGYLFSDLPDELTTAPEEDEAKEAASTLGEDGEEAGTTRRQHDLLLYDPHVKELRYRIHPPPGYTPVDLPEDVERHFGPATYSLESRWTAPAAVGAPDAAPGEDGAGAPADAEVEDTGVLEVVARFDTGGRRYTPQQAEELRAGVLDVLQAGNLPLRFECSGEAMLTAGRVPAALAEFRRLEAAHPDSPVQRNRVVRALIEAGVGEAARREAHRGVELAPESPVAQEALGYALLHDVAGRAFTGDWDRAGAIEALRRAEELKPDDVQVRQNLVAALERDEAGESFAAGADLEAALEEHRYLRDELGVSALDPTFLSTLMEAEHFDEAIELAREMPADALVRGNLIAAVAATEGLAAALREARGLEGDERQEALATAGQRLMRLRRYPLAADLFESAARGAPNPSMVLDVASRLRDTVRHEDAKLDGDGPQDAVRRLFVAMWQGDDAAVRRAFTWLQDRMPSDEPAEDAEVEDAESVAGLMSTIEELQRGLGQQGIGSDVALDLFLGTARLSSEGDDQTGYRVTVEALGGERSRVFVMPSPRGFDVVALASSRLPGEVAAIGWRALDLLRDGKLVAARRWLDWARDEIVSLDDEDPFLTPPFTVLWRRGQEGGETEVRQAAAALLVGQRWSEDVVPVLRQARGEIEATAAAGEEDGAGAPTAAQERKLAALDRALVLAYLAQEREAELEPLARRLCTTYPRSEVAHHILAGALVRLHRVDELRALADARLQEDPDDRGAWILAYTAALAREDLVAASGWLQRRVDAGIARGEDYNQIAWFALYRQGGPDRAALDLAHRAVEKSDGASAAELHTLAAVYAELDQPVAARDVLRQSLDLKRRIEPHDWYVLGRIAESYGELEAAADAYRRLEKPDDELAVPASTWRLAQRRLAGLSPSPVASPPPETSPEPGR